MNCSEGPQRFHDLHTHLWGRNVIENVQEGGKSYSTIDLTLFDLPQNSCLTNILLVRNEYKLAYDSILADTLQNTRCLKSTFLVTGQSGIGITLLLFYILARRLEERQPVAFQIDANIFALFDEGGVSFHPTSALFTRIIPNGAWALSDAVQGQTGPCPAFNCRQVHVIYTSSPASRNWKGWVKQAFVVEYVMDIWSLEELQTLLTISNLDVQQGEALFRKYGPSPRIIVAILLKPEMESAYLRDIRAGAFELAVEFSTVFSDIRQFHFESHLSSTIFILQADTSDSRQPVLRIPTPFLASTLALALFRRTAAQQEYLFTTLSCHSSLCSAVAWIFENYAHAYFSNPNRHPLQARLRNDSNPYYIPTPGWTIAGSTALKTIQPPFNFYWRPRDFNFKGINAVIGIGNNVWVLQFTMSPPQSCATSGLDALFETMNGNADVQWHLAIVGPDLSQAEYARNCQNLTGQWRKTPVYACQLPLGELTEKDQQRLQEISDEFSETYPSHGSKSGPGWHSVIW